jgi:Flp pilus assembly pilin Flp
VGKQGQDEGAEMMEVYKGPWLAPREVTKMKDVLVRKFKELRRLAEDRRGANKLVYMAAAVAIAAILIAIGLNIRTEVDARVDQASQKLRDQIENI